MISFHPAAVLLAATLLVSGCATTPTAGPKTDRYQIAVPKAQFYKYGPAQSFGADFVLAQGQRVRLVKRSFGFSRVVTTDGVSGYVATEEIAPAPPDPPTPPPTLAVARTKGFGSGSGKPRRSNVRPTPGEPLFDVNDVPMPLPDTGPPKPSPSFRF